MTQLINSQFENLASMQKMKTEFSVKANNLELGEFHSGIQIDPELKAVADQFEAIFLEMLLKQARDSKLSDALFDNKADDNFIQLFDRELAKSSSEKVDIGIAEAIINQMALNRPEK